MSDTEAPRTEAGRALLNLDLDALPDASEQCKALFGRQWDMRAAILAIEAEAATAEQERAKQLEASAKAVIDEIGDPEAVATFVWDRLEATPGFNEEMAQALADMKAGRVTRWEDVKRRLDEEGYGPPQVDALPAAALDVLARLSRWMDSMPDAGLNADDPRWDWWHNGAMIRAEARARLSNSKEPNAEPRPPDHAETYDADGNRIVLPLDRRLSDSKEPNR